MRRFRCRLLKARFLKFVQRVTLRGRFASHGRLKLGFSVRKVYGILYLDAALMGFMYDGRKYANHEFDEDEGCAHMKLIQADHLKFKFDKN